MGNLIFSVRNRPVGIWQTDAMTLSTTFIPLPSTDDGRFGNIQGNLCVAGARLFFTGVFPGLGLELWSLLSGADVPRGDHVSVTAADTTTGEQNVEITFTSVTGEGVAAVTSSTDGPAPPSGFKLGSPPTFYEISTTAAYDGSIDICIDYSDVSFGNENNLKLFHYEDGRWTDVTTSRDTANNIICGRVSSLSPFAVFEEEVTVDTRPPTITCPAPMSSRARILGSVRRRWITW